MRLLVTALALLCLGVCADTQNPMELHGLSLPPAPGKEHLRETEIKQLRQELSEMKDLMANVLAFKASEAITEATQQQNRRKLKVLDTKDFVGLRVKVIAVPFSVACSTLFFCGSFMDTRLSYTAIPG